MPQIPPDGMFETMTNFVTVGIPRSKVYLCCFCCLGTVSQDSQRCLGTWWLYVAGAFRIWIPSLVGRLMEAFMRKIHHVGIGIFWSYLCTSVVSTWLDRGMVVVCYLGILIYLNALSGLPRWFAECCVLLMDSDSRVRHLPIDPRLWNHLRSFDVPWSIHGDPGFESSPSSSKSGRCSSKIFRRLAGTQVLRQQVYNVWAWSGRGWP